MLIQIRHPAIGQRHVAAPQWAWVGYPDWVSAGGMFAPLPAAGVRAAKAGLALEFASGDVSTTTGTIAPGISDRLTVVMICESLSSQLSSNFLLGESAASLGSYNYGFYERSSNGGELVFFLHNGATGVQAGSGGASSLWLTTGVPRVWVATYDGATIYLYCDGVAVGSAGQTGSVQRNSTAHLSLGRWNTTSANYRFYAGGVTGRVMGAAEVRSKFGHWRTAYGQLCAPIERRIWVPSAGGGGAVDLAGSATAQAAATGALSVAVSLQGAGLSTATATGTMTHAVPLAGSAAAAAAAGGNLNIAVSLAGAALAQAVAAGAMTHGVPLAGAAAGQASATGALTLQISLAGNAAAVAAASGALTVAGSGLSGAAQAQAGATGSLLLQVPLTAAAIAQAQATGSLGLAVSLSAAALAIAQASGSLQVAVNLLGAAQAQALASGTLSASGIVSLAGAAQAVSTATGTLAGTLLSMRAMHTWPVPAERRRFEVPAELRTYTVQAERRRFEVPAP